LAAAAMAFLTGRQQQQPVLCASSLLPTTSPDRVEYAAGDMSAEAQEICPQAKRLGRDAR
jgi:hypothetical protein